MRLADHFLPHMGINTSQRICFDRIMPCLQQVEQVRKLDAHGSVPYVAEALTRLREEVGNQSTVLGFVGAPFTLATYIVEGGSSKNYTHMKRLMFTQPEVLHAFLTKMADNVADYVRYQVWHFVTMELLNVSSPVVVSRDLHGRHAHLVACSLMSGNTRRSQH